MCVHVCESFALLWQNTGKKWKYWKARCILALVSEVSVHVVLASGMGLWERRQHKAAHPKAVRTWKEWVKIIYGLQRQPPTCDTLLITQSHLTSPYSCKCIEPPGSAWARELLSPGVSCTTLTSWMSSLTGGNQDFNTWPLWETISYPKHRKFPV